MTVHSLHTQVEAALTNDPDNDELLKLKADLTVSDVMCVYMHLFMMVWHLTGST